MKVDDQRRFNVDSMLMFDSITWENENENEILFQFHFPIQK